ncbi:MAG: hypothetical protein Q4F66_06705 [Clostridium sp.]|nr:hypothetical protein [Clostridium sp.]
MNRDFKKLIYIVIGVSIFIMVAKLFIRLLPWLIVVGGIIYIVAKVKGAIEKKKLNDNSFNEDNYADSNDDTVYNSDPEDYTNGEVIDVDYEDVDKK